MGAVPPRPRVQLPPVSPALLQQARRAKSISLQGDLEHHACRGEGRRQRRQRRQAAATGSRELKSSLDTVWARPQRRWVTHRHVREAACSCKAGTRKAKGCSVWGGLCKGRWRWEQCRMRCRCCANAPTLQTSLHGCEMPTQCQLGLTRLPSASRSLARASCPLAAARDHPLRVASARASFLVRRCPSAPLGGSWGHHADRGAAHAGAEQAEGAWEAHPADLPSSPGPGPGRRSQRADAQSAHSLLPSDAGRGRAGARAEVCQAALDAWAAAEPRHELAAQLQDPGARRGVGWPACAPRRRAGRWRQRRSVLGLCWLWILCIDWQEACQRSRRCGAPCASCGAPQSALCLAALPARSTLTRAAASR